jgi:hypothetical protein
MAELKGGTTIGGYTALHSGLKEAYLSGNLTMGGNITIPANGQILSAYNGAHVFKDFNNGHITLSAAGGTLYLGYQNTQYVRLYSNLVYGTSTLIADTSGKLYYQGSDIGTYVSTDLTGTTSYPRLVANNSGATSASDWIRVGSSSGRGLLPYSNGVSNLGASGWNFNQVWANDFYENGSTLSATYLKLAGGTMSGDIQFSGQNNGIGITNVSNSSTPAVKTSGSYVTGGADYAGLGKLNNVAVQTWYGFSVSPSISGQTVAQGVPAFSIDARSGNGYLAGVFQPGSISTSGNINTSGQLQVGTSGNLFRADGNGTIYTASNMHFTVNNKVLYMMASTGTEYGVLQIDGTNTTYLATDSLATILRGSALTVRPSTTFSNPITISNAPDVSLAGGGALIIGSTAGANIAMDYNEIQARNNNAAGSLNLNIAGGNVYIGASGGYVQATPEIFGIGVDTQDTYLRMGSHDVIAAKYGSSTGNGIVIGSGGLTILGAGESAGYLWGSGAVVAGTETLFLTSDNDVTIYPDQNAGYSTKNKIVIDGGAETTMKLYNTQAVSGSTGNVGLELRAEGGGLPYIDFARSTADYTTRVIVDSTNNISIAGGGDFQAGNIKTYDESLWFTADTTGGWHIIAYNGTSTAMATSGGDRAYGKFTIINEDASRHELIQFTAGTAFNADAGITLKMLGKVMFGSSETFGGIRIGTRGTYDTQYLEVWVEPSVKWRTVMEDNYFRTGWKLLDTPIKSVMDATYTISKLEMQVGYEGIPRNLASGTIAPPSQGMFKGDVYIQY